MGGSCVPVRAQRAFDMICTHHGHASFLIFERSPGVEVGTVRAVEMNIVVHLGISR